MSKKILIVDDEPNILLLMEEILEELVEDYGVSLLMAKNGEEALKFIQAERPNLVFLDVMMPKISGLEICQIIKNQPELCDIYIIMLTAKGQEFDKKNGIAMGADFYITKPFHPKEVLDKSLEILALT